MKSRTAKILNALLLASLLTATLGVQPAYAASIVVNSSSDLVGDNGFCTLREAITAANNDAPSGGLPGECAAGAGADTITFNPGLMGGTTITLGSQLPAVATCVGVGCPPTSIITIDGGLTNIIVQANAAPNTATYRVFAVTNTGNLTLNNLTVRNGRCNGSCPTTLPTSGGGILNDGGMLTVTNSTLSNNSADFGGGILNFFGALTVTNSVLSNNSVATTGGGILNYGTLTVTNSTLSANSAINSGGGIYHNTGTLTVTNSTLSNNSADFGGGIFNTGTLSMANSVLTNNSANSFGGGIYNSNSLTVTDSTLSGNTAGDEGGGIWNGNFGTVNINTSTLSSNSATSGGGINNSGGTVSVTASTFSNNNANSGGGIYSFAGTNTLENSTFSENGATVGGSAITAGTTSCAGGIFSINSTTIAAGTGGIAAVQVEPLICVTASLTMSNTIVSRNGETQAFDIAGPFVDAGNNISNSATGTPAGVTVYASLGLGPLANNGGTTQTHALLAGSPAIDAGNNTSCPGTDQRGVARPINTTCDIGAYEAQVVVPTPTPTATSIPVVLPDTGFAPNRLTSLSAQPAHLAYTALGDIWLEIPALHVKTSIVGIPKANNNWKVDWLGKDAGWLHGTAFPSWEGNSVLTGHVYDANGLPGPFVNLKDLKYGDQIIVHMYGEKYIFELREVRTVQPASTRYALKHLEDYSYLTLITCLFYDEKTDSYLYRRIVRAVLVKVQAE